MIASSLILTAVTTLSGVNNVAKANKIEILKQNSIEIIQKASTEFEFDVIGSNINDQFQITKEKILSFYEENNLLNDDYIEAMKTKVVEDDSFQITNIESYELYSFDKISIKNMINDIREISIVENNNNLRFKSGNFQIPAEIFSDLNNKDKSGSNQNDNQQDGTATFQQTLPILEYNSSNVTSTVGGKVDGVNFVGIIANRDSCIGLYNTVARFLNNQVMYGASGIKGPASMIIETLLTLTPALVTTVISALVGYFSGLWSSFCSLFASGGPIGIVVGLIIGLVGAACIATLVTMFVMGAQGKGFAVGWKVYNLFNWKWYCGEAN